MVCWVTIALLVGSSEAISSFLVETNQNLKLAAAPALSTNPSSKASPSPATLPPVGWKTFVSTNFRVAVDYPPDWSVNEERRGVTFRSEQGEVIQLTVIETGLLSPRDFLNENLLPNTRCSSRTNTAQITTRICFDTISRSYSADFVLKSRLLSLSMPRRGDLQVFNGMVESLRPQE